jgi:zinc protease
MANKKIKKRVKWILSDITMYFLFLLVTNTVVGQTFNDRKKTDINGYTYTSVAKDISGVRIYKLKNGLTVYLAQNFDEPRIRSIIGIRAGFTYDPADNTGLAHYLEHLLFRGNDKIGAFNWETEGKILNEIAYNYELHKKETDTIKKRVLYKTIDSLSVLASKYANPQELHQLYTSLGVVGSNGVTNIESTAYINLLPADMLGNFLELESTKLKKASIRNFQREQEIVYEEFNRSLDDIFRIKYHAITEALFPNHPYGTQKGIGISNHLKNPSPKAALHYFDTHYVPANMAVILVGALDFEKTIQLVESFAHT